MNKAYQLVYRSIKLIPDQILQAVNLKNPRDDFNNETIKNIVLYGMGGSALGAKLLDSLAIDQLKVPFEIVNGYEKYRYLDSHTLAIVSSYSGNTQESIKAYQQIKNISRQVVVITDGGELLKEALKDEVTLIDINPINNPSQMPRLGIGYGIRAVTEILSFFNMVPDHFLKDFLKSAQNLKACHSKLDGQAKNLASKLMGKSILIMTYGYLSGTSYTIKNFVNETSKNICEIHDLPEAVHHLMESLQNPKDAFQDFIFWFHEPYFGDDFINKVFTATRKTVVKQSYNLESSQMKSVNKIDEALRLLYQGILVSYHLAVNNKANPLIIPWVDYFKKIL